MIQNSLDTLVLVGHGPRARKVANFLPFYCKAAGSGLPIVYVFVVIQCIDHTRASGLSILDMIQAKRAYF